MGPPMTPIDVTFGGYQGAGSVHHQAAVVFGDSLQATLGRRLRFRLDGDILARGHKTGDLLPMVAGGTFDFCYISSVRFSDRFAAFRALELPFVLGHREAVFAALDGIAGQRLAGILERDAGYRLLGFWDNGFRHISNRVRPIRAPADCRGLRIRTQKSALPGAVFHAFGFEPVAADIKTFLDEIGGGRFDAQDNPLTSIRNFNIQDHHRFITLTGHVLGITLLLVNGNRFRAWPVDVQNAVAQAAILATAAQRRLARAEDAEVLAAFADQAVEVAHLSDAERQAFIDAVAPLVAAEKRALGTELVEMFR